MASVVMTGATLRVKEHRVNRFRKVGEVGATMVEYVLILALIAILCIGVVTALGKQVSCKFAQASAGIAVGAVTPGTCGGSGGPTTTVPAPTTTTDPGDGHGHGHGGDGGGG